MAQGRNTLMDPPIEDLLDKVDSKFTLVALGSARARQVNSYYNSLGEGLGKVVPPQVASVSGKPVSIAFEEIAAGKATYTRPDPDEEAALAAAEADLAGEPVLTELSEVRDNQLGELEAISLDAADLGVPDLDVTNDELAALDVPVADADADADADVAGAGVDVADDDGADVDGVDVDAALAIDDTVADLADATAPAAAAEAEIEVLDVGDEDPTAS
jgi:DNA-directed RNA polymerase subunit omega